MPIRKDQTSYAVANNLKTAMIAKNLYPNVSDANVVYADAGGDQHLCISEQSDGTYRTVAKSNNSTWFDFIDKNDPTLVRMWVQRELDLIVGVQLTPYPISNYNTVKNGNTWTASMELNGTPYTGQSTNVADAIAIMLTNLINAI